MLSRLGITIHFRSTVGDNADRLKEALRLALSRADLLITIGGLGPTMDDITKEVTAEVLGDELVEDHAHAQWLRDRYAQRGIGSAPASFLKQAVVPRSGRGLPNSAGTALGALFVRGDQTAICLPGPPNELIPMVEQSVEPYLRELTAGDRLVIQSRMLRIVGLGESLVEERTRDLMTSENPTVAPYAKTGEVHLRITARAASEEAAAAMIAPKEREIRSRLGDVIYGIDAETLEQVVVRLLTEHQKTLAVAESCSGGLIAKRLTDIPDASHVFGLGLVTYSNEAKTQLLGVPADLIARVGAVSPEVARQMAEGARRAGSADLGVSVTGIAGPGGGTPAKPVGTVHIGLAWDGGAISEHHQFLGRRGDISYRAAQAALALVRRQLLHPGDPQFAQGSR
jgi:nicotinamide-nucleotide amidase